MGSGCFFLCCKKKGKYIIPGNKVRNGTSSNQNNSNGESSSNKGKGENSQHDQKKSKDNQSGSKNDVDQNLKEKGNEEQKQLEKNGVENKAMSSTKNHQADESNRDKPKEDLTFINKEINDKKEPRKDMEIEKIKKEETKTIEAEKQSKTNKVEDVVVEKTKKEDSNIVLEPKKEDSNIVLEKSDKERNDIVLEKIEKEHNRIVFDEIKVEHKDVALEETKKEHNDIDLEETKKEHEVIVPEEPNKEDDTESDDEPDEPSGIDDDPVLDEVPEQRRSGVRAERISFDQDKEVVMHAKDTEDELIIKNAISSNEFLRNVLKDDNLQDIINAMYKRDVEPDEIIITQGEKGMHLFVSASGTYEVIIKNQVENTFSDQRVFGELAILYNAKRLATIKSIKKGQLWVLDRKDYVQIVVNSQIREEEELLSFLKNVPILNSASVSNLRKAANLLEKEFFKTGTEIVCQGDQGDKFYIIRAGTVTVTKNNEGVVATLTRGQFFGEKALLIEDVRQATVTADAPGVECLSLERTQFKKYLGDISTWDNTPKDEPITPITPTPPKPSVSSEYAHIQLKDLKRIKTLGVGGFGRVELVEHKRDKSVYALKYLKKIDMVQQHQVEHAFNEKNIQMSCNSIFIVRLYRTFKDSKYLYLLMESCLGGDLWTHLQKQKNRCFEEGAARFLAACVLEALAFLHNQDFVYRDLKPENLLLDKDGYVKLTDFGFAKQLGLKGKTYTFAGTPEYVAPEIVLNRGHDRAVDYWAFGIFVFELLVGRTPFRTNDPSHMRTYNLILSGIDSVTFPSRVPRSAQNLIKKLCRPRATERLGCQKNGPEDIRSHKWFQGFDWEKLRAKKLKAPFVPKLKSSTDTQYFDQFEEDKEIPVDENSGWDDSF